MDLPIKTDISNYKCPHRHLCTASLPLSGANKHSDFESATIELYPFITNKSRGLTMMVNQVVSFELPCGGTIKITGDEEFSVNLTDSPLWS